MCFCFFLPVSPLSPNFITPPPILVAQMVKNLPAIRRPRFDPWVGEDTPPSPAPEGNGNSLQYSCLENPMDRGAWGRAPVLGVLNSQTRLSDSSFAFSFTPILPRPIPSGENCLRKYAPWGVDRPHFLRST